MSSALEGLKVLDFTQMMNGPFGTMLLADFGADVIKVEPPAGDTMRLTGETFLGDDAVYFLTLNRNKRSVVLDLTTPEGQHMAQEMAKQVDIVVENFRPGVAEKLGISYETLSALNPRLIYCSTSAFGRTGPDSIRPGMDPVVQAMSGIMQLTGDEQTGPLKTGMPYSDLITPLLSTIGVLAAIQSRNKTGRGQRVDLSMLDATIFSMIPRDAYYFATGETPGRIGNAHWQIVPYNTYRTSDDRHVMVIAHTDKFWRVLAAAVGAERPSRRRAPEDEGRAPRAPRYRRCGTCRSLRKTAARALEREAARSAGDVLAGAEFSGSVRRPARAEGPGRGTRPPDGRQVQGRHEPDPPVGNADFDSPSAADDRPAHR